MSPPRVRHRVSAFVEKIPLSDKKATISVAFFVFLLSNNIACHTLMLSIQSKGEYQVAFPLKFSHLYLL